MTDHTSYARQHTADQWPFIRQQLEAERTITEQACQLALADGTRGVRITRHWTRTPDGGLTVHSVAELTDDVPAMTLDYAPDEHA